MIDIRPFRFGDEPILFEVYHSAIHQIACRDYSPEQIHAWAPAEVDPDLWAKRMRGIAPFVAELCGEIVGYADLQPNGYIDHFFVSGRHPRRGIGRALMNHLHTEAGKANIRQLTSDVSITAQPFFAQFGFEIVKQQEHALRGGVMIRNAFMRKNLLEPD